MLRFKQYPPANLTFYPPFKFLFLPIMLLRTKNRFLIVACALLVMVSCKKRKEGWPIDALVPIVDSQLDLQNIFEDDLIQVRDNDLLHLVYENEILDLKLADDFTIPDTTLSQVNPGPAFNLAWDKANPLISDTNESKFEISNANLTDALIKSGTIKFKVSSTITEPTIITYNMSSGVKDGKTLLLSRNLPAGSPGNPSEVVDEVDLSGYLLNLRGKDLNDYNTIFFYFTVRFANPTSPSNLYNYTSADIVTIENSFLEIKPEMVKGVFTTTTEKPDESNSEFDAFNQIRSGSFDVQKAKFSFEFENRIGVDLQGTVNKLTAINSKTGNSVDLKGDFIFQSLNLARAKEDYSLYQVPIIPSLSKYELNEANSNITEFISVMPNEVQYDMDFTINPLGNISGGNDFLFSDYGIKAKLNMSIPLNIRANNLQLIDTVDFDLGEPDEGAELIEGGFVNVHAYNYYPFRAGIQIYTINEDNVILDSLMEVGAEISAGIPINKKVLEPQYSVLAAPVSVPKINLLYKAERAIVKLNFNTDDSDYKDIYASYKTEVKVVGDFKYRLVIK